MSSELFWLTLTAGLALVMWIPYTALYGGVMGFPSATRDVPATGQLPDWAQRCHRAHMNLVESLPPFAILVFVLEIADKTTANTALAAAIFFFARLGHVFVYTMGIAYLRTVFFSIAGLCALYLFYAALT